MNPEYTRKDICPFRYNHQKKRSTGLRTYSHATQEKLMELLRISMTNTERNLIVVHRKGKTQNLRINRETGGLIVEIDFSESY